jgi:hypothetical protein
LITLSSSLFAETEAVPAIFNTKHLAKRVVEEHEIRQGSHQDIPIHERFNDEDAESRNDCLIKDFV